MNARPLASLSSGLLARPGQAKPAMRPQVFAQAPLEDLGWNDMGQPQSAPAVAAPVATPAPVVATAPMPVAIPTPAPVPVAVAPVPPVLAERAELARAVVKPVPARAARADAPGHKAAFTLRLDPDRHLRLRLASAVAGRSSQQLLVEALDAFLDSQPQVETLARQVPAGTARRSSGGKQ